MNEIRISTRIRKHHVAAALALLAGLSYVYSVSLEIGTYSTEADVVGMLPVVAQGGSVAKNGGYNTRS